MARAHYHKGQTSCHRLRFRMTSDFKLGHYRENLSFFLGPRNKITWSSFAPASPPWRRGSIWAKGRTRGSAPNFTNQTNRQGRAPPHIGAAKPERMAPTFT